MAQAELSPQARSDLFSILEYLSDTAGPEVARRYDTDFKTAVKRTGAFPGIGAPRPELGPQTRFTMVGPYLLFYDPEPESKTWWCSASSMGTAISRRN